MKDFITKIIDEKFVFKWFLEGELDIERKG